MNRTQLTAADMNDITKTVQTLLNAYLTPIVAKLDSIEKRLDKIESRLGKVKDQFTVSGADLIATLNRRDAGSGAGDDFRGNG